MLGLQNPVLNSELWQSPDFVIIFSMASEYRIVSEQSPDCTDVLDGLITAGTRAL